MLTSSRHVEVCIWDKFGQVLAVKGSAKLVGTHQNLPRVRYSGNAIRTSLRGGSFSAPQWSSYRMVILWVYSRTFVNGAK